MLSFEAFISDVAMQAQERGARRVDIQRTSKTVITTTFFELEEGGESVVDEYDISTAALIISDVFSRH